jgi:hypothetical protein
MLLIEKYEERVLRLEQDLAEAYQVIGCFLRSGTSVKDSEIEKALDNIISAIDDEPREHEDLLPFPKESKLNIKELLKELSIISNNAENESLPDSMKSSHLKYMIDQMKDPMMEWDKFNRWLGWIQASLVANGVSSLEEQKEIIRKNLSK